MSSSHHTPVPGNGWGAPVRSWRDLWVVVGVVAMIVASFVIQEANTSANSQAIQEIRARRDSDSDKIADIDQRLARIEGKLDAIEDQQVHQVEQH